jgi:hypothetical protein
MQRPDVMLKTLSNKAHFIEKIWMHKVSEKATLTN